ncbi:hypothetical protein AVEN_177321-1 [Araneus ventricosus]|uniref:Uncharacterized protein n=1 Tax=Araneus ventricosus TaxID=182803 RepID=A0A4Y2C546_ARAVE|nr:hypothetical protein AVEN_177321-1 [Araneus ventricosus]
MPYSLKRDRTAPHTLVLLIHKKSNSATLRLISSGERFCGKVFSVSQESLHFGFSLESSEKRQVKSSEKRHSIFSYKHDFFETFPNYVAHRRISTLKSSVAVYCFVSKNATTDGHHKI